MTIKNIFNQYKDLKEPLVTKQTFRTYLGFYDNHIDSVFGSRDIGTLHYIDYQKFANNLLGSGLQPKTVKNIFGVLSAIYHFAKINEWYEGESFPNLVEFPKFDNKYYVTISPDLQKKYIKAIMNFPEPNYKDIFLFLLHGRRVSEVLDLKWEFLDLPQKIMYLPATQNKSRKNISFMLTDKLFSLLRERQAIAIDIQKTIFVRGHVFINPITEKRYANISKVWKRLLKRADLPYMKLHAIRHLVGTYLINELGVSIQEVSVMLGHSDITITQRYYNPKPSIARDCTQSLFDNIEKTKVDEYAKHLDEIMELGEFVKTSVLHDKRFNKVVI